MIVFMVSDGSYSDYRICGIYSTSEKAERAMALYAASEIKEVEMDAMPSAPDGMLWYSVVMDSEGNSLNAYPSNAEYAGEPKWEPYSNGTHVTFRMWATDIEHAVKIANERRVFLIASGEWMTDWKAWREKQADPATPR